MKTILAILLLLASLISNGQTISGSVIDEQLNVIIPQASVFLYNSAFKKQHQLTDDAGKFKFTEIKPGTYFIKVSTILYGDTTFKFAFHTSDTSLVLNIHKYCKYDSSINNKICPTCRKSDKAIPIIYGYLLPTKGKKTIKGDGKTFLSGGCEISRCDPHWYCKRDKTRF